MYLCHTTQRKCYAKGDEYNLIGHSIMFLCNLNENGNTLRCSSDLGGLSSMLQLPRHFSLKRKRNFALFPSPNMPSLGKGRRGGRSERVKKKKREGKSAKAPGSATESLAAGWQASARGSRGVPAARPGTLPFPASTRRN